MTTIEVVYRGPYDSVDVLDWTVPGERYIVVASDTPTRVPALLAEGGYPPHVSLDDDGKPIGSPFGGLLDQDIWQRAKKQSKKDEE